jgi:hypothetical protein
VIKPNDKVIRAINNLDGNLSWQEITGWIEESLFTQSVANNSSCGEVTIKNQGRNLELAEILKHIKNFKTYQNNLKEGGQ